MELYRIIKDDEIIAEYVEIESALIHADAVNGKIETIKKED